MSLVCFASAKGAPGVTLTALGVAAAWPTSAPSSPPPPPMAGPVTTGYDKVFIEADVSGGAVAIRYQMGVSPGLLNLAARSIASPTDADLFESAQLLPGGLPAVLSPDKPEQVVAAVRSSGATLGGWLASHERIAAIADLGRLGTDSASYALATEATVCLLVSRPVADQLQPGAQLLASLTKHTTVGWVLVGSSPYSAQEVEAAFGVPVVASLPDDTRSATALETGAGASRLRRSALVRGLNDLSGRLADHVARQVPSSHTPPPMPPPPSVPPTPGPAVFS